MKYAVLFLLVVELVFARAEVEEDGKVVHIYDIPNSEITDQIQNVHIDTSIKEPVHQSKNIESPPSESSARSGDLQKAPSPVLNTARKDTIAVINSQIKFLFHKPIDAGSINLSWTVSAKKLTLEECIDLEDTANAARIIREHTALNLAETQWLVQRIWLFWKTAAGKPDSLARQ